MGVESSAWRAGFRRHLYLYRNADTQPPRNGESTTGTKNWTDGPVWTVRPPRLDRAGLILLRLDVDVNRTDGLCLPDFSHREGG